MKRSMIFIASLAAVVAFSGMVWAGPYGRGGGSGKGGGPEYYQQLSPQERAQWDAKRAEFLKATLDDRKALANKTVELRTLLAQPQAEQAKVKALAKELVDLRGKISNKRIEILGESQIGQGRGYGRGFGRGYGMPGGYGCPGADWSGGGRGHHWR